MLVWRLTHKRRTEELAACEFNCSKVATSSKFQKVILVFDLFIYHLFHTSLVQGADQHRMGMGTKRIIGPKRGAKPSAYERYTLGVALAVEGYISSRENNWTERETPSLAVGICEFHQSYF